MTEPALPDLFALGKRFFDTIVRELARHGITVDPALGLNRSGAAWPLPRPPDIEIAELGALEPALERYAVHGAIAGGNR